MIMALLEKLPEDASLEQIVREIELVAGIQLAREQARRGEGSTPEEVLKQVEAWVAE